MGKRIFLYKMENWKDVKDYEGLYQVSDLGNVKSTRNNKILTPAKAKNGYLRLCFSVKNKHKNISLHRLVAETFIENLNNKPQVNHINGIKTDNRVENLEWNTCKENINHAISMGIINVKGENNSYSKITKKQSEEIRKSGKTLKELGIIYNVHLSTISLIKNNKTHIYE